jgi:hypothetical protein
MVGRLERRRCRAPGRAARRARRLRAASGLAGLAGLTGFASLAALLAVAHAPGMVGSARAQPAETCPGNLLVNGGFESGFSARGRPAEVVANGWTAWYATLPGVGGLNYAPDYTPARRDDPPPAPVAAGLWSQRQSTQAATHTGGLWQRLALEPGSEVVASVLANAWATDAQDPGRSRPYGTYRLQLGIDPLGGTDAGAASVVWTEPITLTDTWVPLALRVGVDGPAATFFTRGAASRPLVRNVVRWDEACLQVVGRLGEPSATPSPSPPPTRPLPLGSPTATPDLAAARLIVGALLARGQPTKLPEASPGARATLDALATRIAGGPAAGPTPAGPGGEDGEAAPSALEQAGWWLADHVGLLVLALAALVAGVVLALRRPARTAG